MSEAIKKVLFNVDQTGYVTPSEQAQARANIGAAAASDIVGKTVYVQWDGSSDKFADIAAVVAAGNTPVVRYNGYDYICVDSQNDGRFVFMGEQGEAGVFAFIQFYSGGAQPQYKIVPLALPSRTSVDVGKVLGLVEGTTNAEPAWVAPPSLVQKLNYGDLEPSTVSTLLIDSDDPEGYALLKADNVTKGHLVMGPYKSLLDSGVPGVGDSTTPVYIDSNGTFQSCNTLSAGSKISIGPGANNTTVIANTMHESVIDTCLTWDTLANNYDVDYSWGNWRCHVHLAAFSDWTQDDGAIHIRIEHVYKSEAAQKIKCGSYQIQNYYPYKNGNSYEFSNVFWYFDGNDPYATATIPDPYGFVFHLIATTPDRNMPQDQKAHRFLVDTGAPYGEWLELDASVRFMAKNAAPASNGIYLLLKGKYAYAYQ